MDEIAQICPRYHKAIELVGKRWNGAVLRALQDGPRRFTELLEAVPGLHDRLLSERLKQLEAEDLVRRRVYPETPVRIEYELTPQGRDLEKVIAEVERWAHRWITAPATSGRRGGRVEGRRRHEAPTPGR